MIESSDQDLRRAMARMPRMPQSWRTLVQNHAGDSLQLSNITSFLQSLGLSPALMHQSSIKIHDAIDELWRIHVKSYEQTCQTYLELNRKKSSSSIAAHTLFFDNVYRAHEASFIRQLPRIQQEFLKSYQSFQNSQVEPKRTPFNAEYTPLLEKYFEYNAYPSARDREWLARKSMMTVRQIEFQNHRRRARNEGKHLKRITSDPVPVELSLESLERKMSPFIIRQEDKGEPSDDEPLAEAESQETPLSASLAKTTSILDHTGAPSHAYPTPYPPSIEIDPFPCKDGNLKFPAPVWYRKPATHSPSQTSSLTVDELCEMFMLNLHIRDGATKKSSKQHSLSLSQSWYSSRCMGPIPAPHPALIRPSALASLSSPSPAPRSTTPRRRTPKPSVRGKKRCGSSPRTTDAADDLPLSPSRPTTSRSNTPISRVSSYSSLSSHASSGSSSSDLDTPENSPRLSDAINLPAVSNVDEEVFGNSREPLGFQSLTTLDMPFSLDNWGVSSKPNPAWRIPEQFLSNQFPS